MPLDDPGRDAATYLDLLARRTGHGGPENAGPASEVALTGDDRRELVDRVEAEIRWLQGKTGQAPDPDAVQALLDLAKDGLSRLAWDGADRALPPAALSGLEAVVRADGSRPALLVEDDFVDTTAPAAQAWVTELTRVEHRIRRVCQAIGRVDDPSPTSALGYQGTAWMVGDGLVATNYHVLEAIAPGATREDGQFGGRLRTGVAVHFGHEVVEPLPERRFPIRRVVAVGAAGDAGRVHPDVDLNFDGLDVAILQLEPVPRRAFAAPLTVALHDDPVTRGALAGRGRPVYLAGYPGHSWEVAPALFEVLFSGLIGVKRLAPGRILDGPGSVAHDPRGWMLSHDATTLGGSSGSAVVDLLGGSTVLGLHVGGRPGRQNWAHATERTGRILAPDPGVAVL